MGRTPEGYEYVAVDGGVRIERCTVRAQSLVMPESIDGMPVTSIAPYAFEGNAEIRDLACPSQVVEIGSRAFANCTALERITFPVKLTRYDNSWVAGCARLEEIVLPGDVIDLDLPSPAPSGVKRVVIGPMTCTVQIARTWKTRLIHVSVHPENPWLSSDGTCVYSADGTELIVHATKSPDVSVAQGCLRIAARAFEHEKHLEHVNLPEGVCNIGERAFAESTLSRFESPGSLRSIRREAFAGCQSLREVNLAEGLREIESRAFAECTACTGIRIPASVARVELKAFEDAGLQPVGDNPTLAVSAHSKVLFIDEAGVLCERTGDGVAVLEALDGQTKRYRTPNGAVRVSARAFFGHPSLEQLEIAEGVTCIEREAFMRCENLRSVSLPESLQELGDRAFATTDLSSCAVPAGVKHLGECALAFNFKNWHPTTNPPEARAHVTLEPGNNRYFVERGLLYERCEGRATRVVLYVGPDIDLAVRRDARSIAPYAFFGVQGIRELRLPAGIPTGEASFAMRKPPERIVIEGEDGISFDAMHDWRGVCALQRAFAGDGTTNAKLLCTTFDEEALSAQLDYEAFRYMLARLARPDHLEAKARQTFMQTFREQLSDACIAFARHDDRTCVDALAELGLISETNIDQAVEAASTANSAPIMARLHELKRTRFRAAAQSYEL